MQSNIVFVVEKNLHNRGIWKPCFVYSTEVEAIQTMNRMQTRYDARPSKRPTFLRVRSAVLTDHVAP